MLVIHVIGADSAAEYWYDEEVPFWVLVAGADPEQFDLPPPGQE